MWVEPEREDVTMSKNTIPYGYRIIDGKAVVMEEEASRLRVLCQAYLSGMSLYAAARVAGIEKSHGGIRRIMSDKRNLGDTFYPAILGKETLAAIEAERQRREAAKHRTPKKSIDRTAVTVTKFHIHEAEKEHENAYLQAEYIYSLIEREMEDNA